MSDLNARDKCPNCRHTAFCVNSVLSLVAVQLVGTVAGGVGSQCVPVHTKKKKKKRFFQQLIFFLGEIFDLFI